MNKFELEERLINFAVLIIEIANELPNTKAGNHSRLPQSYECGGQVSGQLVRSGTSSALNYGEAQSGESRKDFIHKIKVVLKELRETLVCLKIIHRTQLFKSEKKMHEGLKENDELISPEFSG